MVTSVLGTWPFSASALSVSLSLSWDHFRVVSPHMGGPVLPSESKRTKFLYLPATIILNKAVKRKKKDEPRKKHLYINIYMYCMYILVASKCVNHPPHIYPKRDHSRTVYSPQMTCYRSGCNNQKPVVDSMCLLVGMQLERRQRSRSVESVLAAAWCVLKSCFQSVQ